MRRFRRHPGRMALMVLSVALGIAAWTTTDLLDRTLDVALGASSSPAPGRADLRITRGDLGVPRELERRIAGVTGVASVRPVLVRRVLLTAPIRRESVLIGLDVAAGREDAQRAGLVIRGVSAAALTRATLSGESPVVVGEALDRDLPAGERSLEVLVSGTPRRLSRVGVLEARGSVASIGGSVLLTDLGIAGRLCGEHDRVTRLDLVLAPGANRGQVRTAIEGLLGDWKPAILRSRLAPSSPLTSRA